MFRALYSLLSAAPTYYLNQQIHRLEAAQAENIERGIHNPEIEEQLKKLRQERAACKFARIIVTGEGRFF